MSSIVSWQQNPINLNIYMLISNEEYHLLIRLLSDDNDYKNVTN